MKIDKPGSPGIDLRSTNLRTYGYVLNLLDDAVEIVWLSFNSLYLPFNEAKKSSLDISVCCTSCNAVVSIVVEVSRCCGSVCLVPRGRKIINYARHLR